MAKIDGGELIVRALQREGIDRIFTLHGGHLDPLYQACLNHSLRVIDFRHEQAAGHAADGWARTTGKPAVCVITAGPGVTDVVTGVANAFMDGSPMVVIGGRSGLIEEDRLGLQHVDQIGLMKPITKLARTIIDPKRIPEYVAIAFRVAMSGRPGPVFLEIPVDVIFRQIEEDVVPFPQGYRTQARPAASAEAIEQAAQLLSKAARPLLLAGSGAWFSQAFEELRQLAERAQIPVCTDRMARGAISDEHPLCAGSSAMLGDPSMQAADTGPDVIVLLGARIGLFLAGGRLIPHHAKVIQIDIEAEEIGRNRAVDVGVVGDAREVVRQLLQRLATPAAARAAWLAAINESRQRIGALFQAAALSDAKPIHPLRLCTDLCGALDPDAVIVADGGDTASWMSVASRIRHPGHWLSHGYLGCLGTGLPFAIAAKSAHPDTQVLCIIGDGAVGLNFMEFHTAVRHNLPFIAVVNNDQAWGMSKHGQEIVYGKDRLVAVELGPARYDKLVTDLGGYGELVEDPKEIVPALRRAVASRKVACLNVMTDTTAVSPATYFLLGMEFGLTPEGGA